MKNSIFIHEDYPNITFAQQPQYMVIQVDRDKNSIWKRLKELIKFIAIGKAEFKL